MAKPKFELTADLVRVEPEPEVVNPQQKNEQVHKDIMSKVFEESKNFSLPAFESFSTDKFLSLKSTAKSPQNNYFSEQREEEREAISMKISKDLKKSFHLWCVQRGITMTDAIEIAIKKYLQE